MQTKTKHRIVYSMANSLRLQELGHKVVGTMPNIKNPELLVWIFEKDATLEADLQSLIKEGKGNG